MRDQFEAPAHLAHQDLQRARVKRFIDSRLDDPDLSLESIAQGCGMSLRSLHRAFAADPAGSVSKHLWVRRLDRCAADPGSDSSASAGYRHLFFLGLQQHVPFQSFVQGAVRGLTTRLPDSIPERLRNSGAKFKPPFPGRGGLAISLSAIPVSGAPTLPDRISVAPLPNCLQSLFWRTCLENTDAHRWRANPNPMREPGGVVQKSCNALPLKTTRPERSCPLEWCS